MVKMVDTQLRFPRSKRTSKHQYIESPFPVPIKTITNKPPENRRWYYYFGFMKDDHVIVSGEGDMTFLYRLGFFGKGNLSRSKPQFSQSADTFNENTRQLFLRSKRKLSEDQRKMREACFDAIHQERVRIHSEWAYECKRADNTLFHENDDTGATSGNTPEQYDDLCIFHDDNIENYSTEGEEELQQPEETGTENTIIENVDVTDSAKDVKPNYFSMEYNVEHDEHPPQKIPRLEDPYKIKEFLCLTLEEAFFLSYGLGCLSVNDENKVPMTISGMWKRFMEIKSNFLESYVVYHYFRSKGWVVRSGVMYGTDYVLYKDGPQFFHSSYAVVVLPDVFKEGDPICDKLWSWSCLTGLNRVVENVAKELLLCFVIKTKDFEEDDLNTPACIKQLKVKELLFRRWVPEKFREKQGNVQR